MNMDDILQELTDKLIKWAMLNKMMIDTRQEIASMIDDEDIMNVLKNAAKKHNQNAEVALEIIYMFADRSGNND